MLIIAKLTHWFNKISIKIPADFFVDVVKLILKFIWKGKGPRTTKTFWNRTQLKTYMISKLARKLCNQDDGVLYKKRCTDQWNTRELKKNPTHT